MPGPQIAGPAADARGGQATDGGCPSSSTVAWPDSVPGPTPGPYRRAHSPCPRRLGDLARWTRWRPGPRCWRSSLPRRPTCWPPRPTAVAAPSRERSRSSTSRASRGSRNGWRAWASSARSRSRSSSTGSTPGSSTPRSATAATCSSSVATRSSCSSRRRTTPCAPRRPRPRCTSSSAATVASPPSRVRCDSVCRRGCTAAASTSLWSATVSSPRSCGAPRPRALCSARRTRRRDRCWCPPRSPTSCRPHGPAPAASTPDCCGWAPSTASFRPRPCPQLGTTTRPSSAWCRPRSASCCASADRRASTGRSRPRSSRRRITRRTRTGTVWLRSAMR